MTLLIFLYEIFLALLVKYLVYVMSIVLRKKQEIYRLNPNSLILFAMAWLFLISGVYSSSTSIFAVFPFILSLVFGIPRDFMYSSPCSTFFNSSLLKVLLYSNLVAKFLY